MPPDEATRFQSYVPKVLSGSSMSKTLDPLFLKTSFHITALVLFTTVRLASSSSQSQAHDLRYMDRMGLPIMKFRH